MTVDKQRSPAPLGNRMMTALLPARGPAPRPPHPGAVLRDTALPSCRASKAELARMLGITPQHLRSLLSEQKPITPDLAAHLGKMFGNGAGAWIALQSAYDEWTATHEVDVTDTPTLTASPLPTIASRQPPHGVLQGRTPDWLGAVCLFGIVFSATGLLFMALIPTLLFTLIFSAAATGYLMLRVRRRRERGRSGPYDGR